MYTHSLLSPVSEVHHVRLHVCTCMCLCVHVCACDILQTVQLCLALLSPMNAVSTVALTGWTTLGGEWLTLSRPNRRLESSGSGRGS